MEPPKRRLKIILARAFAHASVQDKGLDPSTGAARMAIHASTGDWLLNALWVGEGWPADVRGALDTLPSDPVSREFMLIARRFSPGAIELLEEKGANWADESGAAHIEAPGLLVIRDAESAREQAHHPPFSWSPSALAAAESLLARDWPTGIGTTELATLTHHSPAQVSQVLQRFDELGWTVKYGPKRGPSAHRELIEQEELLNAWASALAAQERDVRLAHRTMRSPLSFLENELSQALEDGVRWALSGWAAANELAPLVDTVPSLQIYVHEDDFATALDRAMRDAGLSDVAEGGRVAFLPATDSIFALANQGASGPIVSAPRVYADLLWLGGRGEEAAEHLKEEVLDQSRFVRGATSAPAGLVEWERDCLDRLASLTQERPRLAGHYERGSWSASYRLLGVADRPDLRRFMAVLREVAGHETGWPPWWVPTSTDLRPQPVAGAIECWFDAEGLAEWAEIDYWRADPEGRLFLLRPYQEDASAEGLTREPRTKLDLNLPIWRTGECLLHAERLALRLDATKIQFMTHWTGLEGRRLATVASQRHRMTPTSPAAEDEVVSYIELSPEEIQSDLAGVVRDLVDPLYAVFDFFEPPSGIYEEELAEMRSGSNRVPGH